MKRLFVLIAIVAVAVYVAASMWSARLSVDVSARSTYCQMVDIWLQGERQGLPADERYGWPPRGVPGRNYSRDCQGDS